MKYILTLSLLILFNKIAQAQTYELRGTVLDERKEIIPFASIFKANSSIGTSANSEGHFKLSLPKGTHQLTITAVGYQPSSLSIDFKGNDTISVQLERAVYTLQEVVIGNQEDPAYAIIRKAIKKRPTYLSQSGPYTARVYIKGLQRLTKAPKKFLGLNIEEAGREMGLDSNRRGIIYLSESESTIQADPPKHFKEEMISSKVSGNNRAFSFNRASELQLNFYENYQNIIEGLSNRPFISPIADNALTHYNYQYMGSSNDGGLLINKIKVIPKRKAEPLYKGDLYIVEDDWRIHSVNLLLDKASSINFVDSLNIKQLFTPVEQQIWMPSNVQLDFKGGILGFEVDGYFTAVYQDYVLSSITNQKIFQEVLSIGRDVNKKDSVYWADSRPIPLTAEEQHDYVFKDSLRKHHESKSYLDSVDKKHNRFKPLGFLVGGYHYRNRYKKEYIHMEGLIPSLLFNSVEGLAINYGAGYSKQVDSARNRYFRINGHVRYGFVNQRFNGNISTSIPIKNQTLILSGGSDVLDLNNRGSLPTPLNSIYTLFIGENYQKLYEKRFAAAQWNYTLPHNIKLDVVTEWAHRHWLPNASDFTFWDRNRHKLTSNNPFNSTADVPLFDDNQSTKISVGIRYDFSTHYETYPTGRQYLPSKFPTFSMQYTKGIKNILGSDVDYDLLTAGLYKSDIPLGMYGKIAFAATAGKFLNNNSLFYPDFRHFNGNQIVLVDQQLSSFLSLDYYQHSTNTQFLEAHTEYNLSGTVTSKIPLLRTLKLEEIIGLHYLHTPEMKHYGELHLGLQWKMLRVIYAHTFSSNDLLKGSNTIRVGLKFF